jgi:hypothetical protein
MTASAAINRNAGIQAIVPRPGGAKSVRHRPPREARLPSVPSGESDLALNRNYAKPGCPGPSGCSSPGTNHGRFTATAAPKTMADFRSTLDIW